MSYNVSDSTFKVGVNAPYVVTGTDVAVVDGGTGASTAAAARTNLGVVIGTDVQAYDAELAALSALASAADNVPYFTGAGTAALASFTAAGRALVDDADASAQRTTLGLGTIATQASSSVSITGGTMSGVTITSLPAPVSANDAARKTDVDAAKQGLDFKDSVRVVTDAALPAYTRTGDVITASANGALTVDGVAVAVNDRVLVKNGAAGADNGIYDVTATGSGVAAYVLTRSSDANTNAKVTTGMYSFVSEGTNNADSAFVLTTNDAITLNTTALTFAQFSGAGQITAGNGLTKTGNTFDVGAGTGISVTADAVGIAAGGVGTTELANLAVSTAKIQASAVTSAELAANAVIAGKIAAGGVSANTQFAAGVVDTAALANDSVDATKLKDDAATDANRAVTTDHIRDSAIVTGKINNLAVTTAKIAASAVTTNELGNLAVTTAKIAASAVTTNELGANAVTPAKADLTQTWAHGGILFANGGFQIRRVVTAVNYTTLASDVYVGVTDTAAARTITLVAAATAGNGAMLTVKDQSGGAGTNNITVDGNVAENIDGAATKVINTNYGSVTLVCDGANWFVT